MKCVLFDLTAQVDEDDDDSIFEITPKQSVHKYAFNKHKNKKSRRSTVVSKREKTNKNKKQKHTTVLKNPIVMEVVDAPHQALSYLKWVEKGK